jgi:uncharacterized protein (DUF983 family)
MTAGSSYRSCACTAPVSGAPLWCLTGAESRSTQHVKPVAGPSFLPGWQDNTMPDTDQNGRRDMMAAIKNGLRQRCPACGKGRLYRAYLKVADACPSCGIELHHQRADDAPPYVTMLITGHIVVAALLAVERTFQPPEWVHLVIWLPVTALLSLWLLPRIKGGLVAIQWAAKMHGFDPAIAAKETPDPSGPEVWSGDTVKLGGKLGGLPHG